MPDELLTDLQDLSAAACKQTLTNTRTSFTGPCGIFTDTRNLRFEGLGRMVETRRWRITQPIVDGVLPEVRPGDPLLVDVKGDPDLISGTYSTLEWDGPKTFPTAVRVFAILQRFADGKLNLLVNETVTFTSARGGADTITIRALVNPASQDAVWRDPELLNKWLMVWDPELGVYPSGDVVSSGHGVDWIVNGNSYHGNLEVPHQNVGPELHEQCWVYNVEGGTL
jgi:hypothetical protein